MKINTICLGFFGGVCLTLFAPAVAPTTAAAGDLDAFMEQVEEDGNKGDLALARNSFYGNLRYWNGVDSENVTGKGKPLTDKEKQAAPSWGWRFNTGSEAIERIAGKDIPVSALVSVPEDGQYRIWLRHVADNTRAYPSELKVSGANQLEHTFGQFTLSGDSSAEQEKKHSICFEDEAVRATFPGTACQVWEYRDVELKKGNSLFQLSTKEARAPFSHLFITGSKTFTPRLPKQEYTTMLLPAEYQDSTLLRSYYRFKVREGNVPKYRFKSAQLKYHWFFDPKKETYDGIWTVGLAQDALASRRNPPPVSVSGKPDIACGEWSDWVDATWASQGAGLWATGVLEFERLKRGKCDIELAWHPHPAAVVKTVTIDVEDGIGKFVAPLISGGKGRVVFPDRQNTNGVWGVVGPRYLDWFKNLDGFNDQYMAWVKDARDKLGITGDIRIPPRLRLVADIHGTRAEQRPLAKVLVAMGFNGIDNLPPDICKEVGIEPLITAGAGAHTSDPEDPARPIVVRQAFEAMAKRQQEAIPDYTNLLRIINVGDEIGPICGTYKINQSVECLKSFHRYLAKFLKDNQLTPAFFGVESLDDLETTGQLPANPGLFERRLYNHSIRFREIITGDYYRPITDAAKAMFPNAITYANYSPAPLRQGSQVHDLTWFTLPRQGALTLAWGEDWVYPIGAFTGYEIVSYYAAMVECAARALKCEAGFYNVAGGSVIKSDTSIMCSLSRNLKHIYVFTFGPSYNATGADPWEGCWSDIPQVYPDLVKANYVASFVGPHLAEGKIEERKVALLYNRDDEVMNGGYNGQQSDRAIVFAALGNCNRNADLILNQDLTPDILKQYSALFINGFSIPKAAVPVLKAWVEKGGLLVATSGTGVSDEYNSPLPEMEEVLGARQFNTSISAGYITPATLNQHRPIGQITVQDTEFTPAFSADVVGLRTTIVPTTAQPFATFEDGTCAGALNKLGKGYVMLWGVQPGIIYRGRREGPQISRYVDERLAIFEKPLQKVMGASPLSTDAPQVELTRFELGGETAILVNNMKKYAWREDLPLAEIRLKTDKPVKDVGSAMKGKLQWRRDGDWVKIACPVPASIDSIRVQ